MELTSQVLVHRVIKFIVLPRLVSVVRILGLLNVLTTILIRLDGHVENLARLPWNVTLLKLLFRMEKYNVIPVRCYVIMGHVHLVKFRKQCHVTVGSTEKRSIVQIRNFQKRVTVRMVTNQSLGWVSINVKMSAEGNSS